MASPKDRVHALREQASNRPHEVNLSDIEALASADDTYVQTEALHALVDVIDARPADALDLLTLVTMKFTHGENLVQCAALYCLSDLAAEYPRQVTPVADDVVALLDPSTAESLLEGAIPYVASVAETGPKAVRDAAPKLAALLQAGTVCESEAVLGLARIAEPYPEAVTPATTELLSYLDSDATIDRVVVLAAVGYVSKQYPMVAEESIPTVVELLDAENYRVRANAAGLLAELTNDYPDRMVPDIPRFVELLDDDDEKARYNATSILAGLAKTHPEQVRSAVEGLVEMLDEEFQYSRSNACWALGRIRAPEAREKLQIVAQSDPKNEVRETAERALEQIGRE
jgi:HEAT repeat protein